jgi:hypothetical protein
MIVTSIPVRFSIDAVARPPKPAPTITIWGAISDMLTGFVLEVRAGRVKRACGKGRPWGKHASNRPSTPRVPEPDI